MKTVQFFLDPSDGQVYFFPKWSIDIPNFLQLWAALEACGGKSLLTQTGHFAPWALCTEHCALNTEHSSLCTKHSALCAFEQCVMYRAHSAPLYYIYCIRSTTGVCTLYASQCVQCTLRSVHFKLHCTLFSAEQSMLLPFLCSVQCEVCSVQCAVYTLFNVHSVQCAQCEQSKSLIPQRTGRHRAQGKGTSLGP